MNNTAFAEVFPGGSLVKNPPANAGNPGSIPWVGKIPWRRKWPPYSSILAWRIPWTEEPGGLQSIGSQSRTQLKRLSLYTYTSDNLQKRNDFITNPI